jgi:type IV pilus assembly protein PilX
MSRLPVRSLSARLPPRSRQRGVALAMAMILLIVITLVGIAAVSGTLGQQKMSGNFYDRQVAFQETEAAMRVAALAIQTATTSTPAPAGFLNCAASSGNVCQSNPFTDPGVTATPTAVTTTQYQYGGLVAGQPQYFVQYMGNFQVPNPPVKQTSKGSYGQTPAPETADFYRITARSADPTATTGRAYVILQSVFRN